MKRIFYLILIALLLSGCAAAPQETTEPPVSTAPADTMPTEPAGIYHPGSDVELLTGGAVRQYQPEAADSYALAVSGNDLLVFSGRDKTTLTLLAGDTLYPVAGAELACPVSPEDPAFQISAYGITYYDPEARELIFLDRELKEVSRLAMSSDMVGKPVLSTDRLKVFYCTGDAVRVYDLETGLDRLLRSISYPQQSVEAVLLNNTVIRCSLVDSTGLEYAVFFSAENGQLVAEAPWNAEVFTSGTRYYARIPEDTMEVSLFGEAGQEPGMILPADPFADAWFLPESHALVTLSRVNSAAELSLYPLENGRRTALVNLPGNFLPLSLTKQEKTGEIYLLGRESDGADPVILRWNPELTPAEDSAVYTSRRYTLENPDTDGLAQCAQTASELGERYGLQILLGPDAAAQEPWDYTLESEYHIPVIRQQLGDLARCLEAFPEDFFRQIPGQKQICLVRSITGKPESGSVEAASGLQYWLGDTACVALIPGETMAYSFFHETFHVIDSKVLSDSRLYYYWHTQNPDGCKYFEDYTTYRTKNVEKYLQEEDRVFIDAYSMSYPKEDRARIMEYASNPGNEHYFQSDIMQKKLRTLCRGIREAFGLKEHPEPFLWEQYLEKPLTPKDK